MLTVAQKYFHAVAYVVSAAVFIAAVQPKIVDDYLRISGLALTVVVVSWTLLAPFIYRARYYALPPERRGRMMKPYLAWWMGVAFLLAISDNVIHVIRLFGKPLQPDGLPLLYAILLASAIWLYPLVRMEMTMKDREDTARQEGKL